MKDQMLRFVIGVQNKIKEVIQPTDSGTTYVDTGVKVIIVLIVGGILLTGLTSLIKGTVLIDLNTQVTKMFSTPQ